MDGYEGVDGQICRWMDRPEGGVHTYVGGSAVSSAWSRATSHPCIPVCPVMAGPISVTAGAQTAACPGAAGLLVLRAFGLVRPWDRPHSATRAQLRGGSGLWGPGALVSPGGRVSEARTAVCGSHLLPHHFTACSSLVTGCFPGFGWRSGWASGSCWCGGRSFAVHRPGVPATWVPPGPYGVAGWAWQLR